MEKEKEKRVVHNEVLAGELISVKEAADLLRVSRRTIVRWMDEGLLPAYAVAGRVRLVRSDVLALIRERKPRCASV